MTPLRTCSRPRASPALAGALALATLAARADCIDEAAQRHHVNALVLRAIGWQESRLRPDAVGRNANGSVDVGAFQINSVHLDELGRYGIDRAELADGCVSAEVAAWHYRRQVDACGDTWQAVGAYHSHTDSLAARYANSVAEILRRWHVMPPGPPPLRAGAVVVAAAGATRATAAAAATAGSTVSPTSPTTAPRSSDISAFGEIAYLPPAR